MYHRLKIQALYIISRDKWKTTEGKDLPQSPDYTKELITHVLTLQWVSTSKYHDVSTII